MVPDDTFGKPEGTHPSGISKNAEFCEKVQFFFIELVHFILFSTLSPDDISGL